MSQQFEISGTLRSRRSEAGLTQEQAANIMQVSRSAYAAYEEGRTEPGVIGILKLSRGYGFKTIDSFLGSEQPTGLSKIEQSYYKAPIDKRRIIDFVLSLK